jgi:putative effector of murein hydrolase LrgA (UPF0299 family)
MNVLWKLAASVIVAALAFLLLHFIVGALVATVPGSVAGAVLVAVWDRTAVWELKRAAEAAKGLRLP